jgi:hypothetical protein
LLRTRVKGGGPSSSNCSGEDLLWQALGGSLVESVPRGVATPTTFDALPSLCPAVNGGDGDYNVTTIQSIVTSNSQASAYQSDLTCVSEDDTGCRHRAEMTTTPLVQGQDWRLRSFPLADVTTSTLTTTTATTNHAELPMFPDLSGSSTYHPGLLTSSHIAEILVGEVSSPYHEMDVAVIQDPSQQQQQQSIQEVSLDHCTNLPCATPSVMGECIPWFESGNLAGIPSTVDAVCSDDYHHPQAHDAQNVDECQGRGGNGGYENCAVGFFEGQTFRCMDDENLRVYESKIIGA